MINCRQKDKHAIAGYQLNHFPSLELLNDLLCGVESCCGLTTSTVPSCARLAISCNTATQFITLLPWRLFLWNHIQTFQEGQLRFLCLAKLCQIRRATSLMAANATNPASPSPCPPPPPKEATRVPPFAPRQRSQV